MRLTPLRLAFLFGAALFLLGPTAGFTQPGGGKGGKGGGKGGQGGGGMQFDPAAFAKSSFDRMANGKDVIVIAEVPTQGKRGDNPQEALRTWAESHNVTNGQITLDQYTQYMQDRMQQGGGMGKGGKSGGGPGGPGGMRIQRDPSGGDQGGGGPNVAMPPRDYSKDAEDNFRRHDKDNEGKLTPENMPNWLKDEWQQWDKNGDGFLDLAEYKEAYKAHQEFLNPDGSNNRDPRNPRNRDNQQADPVPEEDKRPTVYHVGNLPKELPAWFVQLDMDKDGQVGLYEWKRGNMDINLFLEIDRNGDGFLTVEEVLRWQKVQIAAKKKAQGNTVAFEDEDNPDGTPNAQPNVTIPNTTYPNMRGPGNRGPGGNGNNVPNGFTRPGGDGGNGPTRQRPGQDNNSGPGGNRQRGGGGGKGPGSRQK